MVPKGGHSATEPELKIIGQNKISNDKELGTCFPYDKQQTFSYIHYGLRRNSMDLWVLFTRFPHFNVFINIYEYANLIICIFDHKMKGLCLSFNLVPILSV